MAVGCPQDIDMCADLKKKRRIPILLEKNKPRETISLVHEKYTAWWKVGYVSIREG